MASSLLSNNPAIKWLDLGLESHNQGILDFLSSKKRIFTAGKCFAAARAQFGDRDGWEDVVKCWIASRTPKGSKPSLSFRSVQAYIKFFTDLIEWAKAEKPNATANELEDIAVKMAIDTPGSYMQVLRSINLLRDPFGYDADKYQRNKVQNSLGQIEFDFDKVASSLDVLTKIGTDNFVFKLPENKTEAVTLTELKAKLEAALKQIESKLADSNAVEVDSQSTIADSQDEGSVYVIRRDALPGILDQRPRYYTPGNGFTYDLQKAARFNEADAFEAKHHEDVVVLLSDELSRVKAELEAFVQGSARSREAKSLIGGAR